MPVFDFSNAPGGKKTESACTYTTFQSNEKEKTPDEPILVLDNQLTAHLTLDIPNAQIATFIPDWNKTNQELASGKIDKEEYDIWLEDTLKLFNVPIDEYL